MFMKMFQIFGMLSSNHQKDCLSILDYLTTSQFPNGNICKIEKLNLI